MDKKTLIRELRKLLKRPEAIVFRDDTGMTLNGRAISNEEYERLQKSHDVKTINWIES